MSTDASADPFVAEPWAYPGEPVESTEVLHGCKHHLMSPSLDRRLGQARVSTNCDPPRVTLNEFLLSKNAASVDARTVVVAVGSNASPVVLNHKFGKGNVSTTIPFVTATMTGVAS